MEDSKIYKMYELRDSLKEGIEKHKELVEVENEFLEVIVNSGKKEKFQFMLNDWENNKKGLEAYIPALEDRLKAATELVEMYEKKPGSRKTIDKITTLVFNALGIVDKPQEQVEEIEIELPQA